MGKVDAIDIRPCDLETVREILRRHVPDKEVWAFGSRVQWTARDYSDLDLAIRTDEPIPLKVMGAISEELSESNLPMKVDVLDMARVSEKFRGIIEEYAVVQEKNVYGNWKEVRLADVADISTGKSNRVDAIEDGKYAFFDRSKDVRKSSRYLFDCEAVIVPGEGKEFIPRYFAGKFDLHQRAYAVTNFQSVCGRFVYYAMGAQRKYFERVAVGSTVKSLRLRMFQDFPLKLPPLGEQKKIAHILGTLDDKIELNRRMNKTLEAMAQAIFKSWFVDFDPVHAKAEGRDTGLPPEIADLFSDGFEDSILGPIPNGWKVAPLSEVAELQTDMVQPYKSPENLWEHYSIPAYDSGHRPAIEPGANIKSGKYLVPENAVLISKLNPRFPRVWLPDLSGTHRPICSTEFLPFVPHHPDWRLYLYHLTLSPHFQVKIANRVTGTSSSHQRAKPSDIAGIAFPSPPAALRVMFGVMAGSLSTRMQTNLRASHSLTVVRDALLPRLLSGSLSSH